MNATAQTLPPSSEPTQGGRDDQGLFAAGNAGGPGNPFARQVAALRKKLLDTVTDQDMVEVTHALLLQAKAGKVAAAKLLLQYTLGKPAPATDPDRLPVHEWQTFKEQAEVMPELVRDPGLLTLPDPELPLHLLRHTRTASTFNWGERIHDVLLTGKMPKRTRKEERGRPSPDGHNGRSGREDTLYRDPAQHTSRGPQTVETAEHRS